jgi:Gpi18-like mannosyltransferase
MDSNQLPEDFKQLSIKQPTIPKKDNIFSSLLEYLTFDNLVVLCVFVCLIVIRVTFFPIITADYGSFLKPWSEYFATHGDFWAFKDAFYNYTPPYLYLLWIGTYLPIPNLVWVKSVTIFFEIIMAFFVAKIVILKRPALGKVAFLVTLAMPNVIINGSWWGQCDAIYSTFAIISLYYILVKKHLQSILFFGIAISIKLQAIFFAPVFVFLAVTKNIKKRFVLILPLAVLLVYVVLSFPAFVAGRPYLNESIANKNGLLSIYANQSESYGSLVMGPIPSIHQWLSNTNYKLLYPAGVLMLVAILGTLISLLNNLKTTILSNDQIIKLALFVTMLCPFVLPKMHERYMFLGEVIAVIYLFYFPKKFVVPFVINTVAFAIYVLTMIGGSLPMYLTKDFNTLWILFVVVYLGYDLFADITSIKKPNLHTLRNN